MDPRKKASRPGKSTNLPKEFMDNVKVVFAQAFKKQLKGKPLLVEGRIYPDEILLSVGFKEEAKALRQTNFEASIDHNGKDVLKKLNLCVDAISSMMLQFFDADGDIDLPKQWSPFKFENDTIHLQSTGRNTELEAEANKILGLKSEDELLIDEAEERALAGESPDEEEDLPEVDEDPGETTH
jgi:hypothetical protein